MWGAGVRHCVVVVGRVLTVAGAVSFFLPPVLRRVSLVHVLQAAVVDLNNWSFCGRSGTLAARGGRDQG